MANLEMWWDVTLTQCFGGHFTTTRHGVWSKLLVQHCMHMKNNGSPCGRRSMNRKMPTPKPKITYRLQGDPRSTSLTGVQVFQKPPGKEAIDFSTLTCHGPWPGTCHGVTGKPCGSWGNDWQTLWMWYQLRNHRTLHMHINTNCSD